MGQQTWSHLINTYHCYSQEKMLYLIIPEMSLQTKDIFLFPSTSSFRCQIKDWVVHFIQRSQRGLPGEVPLKCSLSWGYIIFWKDTVISWHRTFFPAESFRLKTINCLPPPTIRTLSYVIQIRCKVSPDFHSIFSATALFLGIRSLPYSGETIWKQGCPKWVSFIFPH